MAKKKPGLGKTYKEVDAGEKLPRGKNIVDVLFGPEVGKAVRAAKGKAGQLEVDRKVLQAQRLAQVNSEAIREFEVTVERAAKRLQGRTLSVEEYNRIISLFSRIDDRVLYPAIEKVTGR